MSTSAAWSRHAKIVSNNDTNFECESPGWEEHWIDPQWVDLFTRDMIAIMGVFGNIILIVVRMQKDLNNTFNKLLIALAFLDIFTLIIFLAISICKTSEKIFNIMFPYFLWPVAHIAVNSSTFMTVVIAYERYMAVHKPLNFKIGRRYRVVRYVTFVIIIDIIINVPKFFEYEPDKCNGIRFTKLYVNKIYSVYNIVLHKLLISAFIMSLLIYFYAKIYHDIRESHTTEARHSVRGRDSLNIATSKESMRKKESKQASIFAGVVIACLISHSSDVFVTAAHIIQYVQNTTDPPLWFLIALKIRDFLMILNSALNVVIYTCLSKQFRDDFKTAFLTCKIQNPTISANANSIHLRKMSTTHMPMRMSTTEPDLRKILRSNPDLFGEKGLDPKIHTKFAGSEDLKDLPIQSCPSLDGAVIQMIVSNS